MIVAAPGLRGLSQAISSGTSALREGISFFRQLPSALYEAHKERHATPGNSALGSRNPWPRQDLIPYDGTYPRGWKAGGWATGVKRKAGLKDLTLIVSPHHPCTASAVFTTNSFAAAPVQVSREIVSSRGSGDKGVIKALVVNSGCANACTGDQGLKDAWEMSRAVDKVVGITGSDSKAGTVVMSTGVIGQHLQMDRVLAGITDLSQHVEDTHNSWLGAAEGIMTTDTFPKLRSQEFTTKGGSYRMAGWSKGAGMIHPNMATMLSAIFTDVKISKPCLDSATKYAADRSFNAISIDGDTSTNDTFIVLANGASGVVIDKLDSKEFVEFRDNLTAFAAELAKLIVRDGEGATKFVEIQVKSARSFAEAKTIASTIATSPLVKTAIYGKDANWGRIVCAVGYSGIPITPNKVNLYVGSPTSEFLHLFKDGAPFDVDEDKAAAILENEDIIVRVELGLGSEEAKMYTCDFSHGYISINADYRS
ncbi:hypothetical protein SpCBS45565_g02267 [Spizellomyces sp. 'palustris']|nr:hypothetical protein SpCBS45565_g02267 [Spizellomyces sp. 'palustris']